MRQVVVDTNCLLRMIPLRSKYRLVWEAIIASADFLVSEDKHFNVLKDIPFPKVNVITLEQFLIDLQKRPSGYVLFFHKI